MRNLVTCILLAATIAKFAVVLAIGPASIELDAKSYWQLSDLVIDGDLFMLGNPIAYRTPIYPWFLAVVQFVFGTGALGAIVVLQALMAVATIWIAGKIAAELTQSDWAMPLTILVALPALSAVTYSATVLTETLFTALLMLNLWSTLMYVRTPTLGRAAICGVTYALAMLTRPVMMHLWVAHVVFVLAVRKRTETGPQSGRISLGKQWSHIGVAALTVAILISPWLLRNQHLFGSPFLTEFLGRNIWIVTFQDGSGAGLDLPATVDAAELKRRLVGSDAAEQWRSTWPVSRALVASGLNDPEADQLMKQVSIDAIHSGPGPFAYKAVRRTANFWRCAVTDLPVQGSGDGQYQGQRFWSFDLAAVAWAIDHRLSRRVWFNTLVTTIIGFAVMILILHRDTRWSGVWVGLILSYFAAVTGLVEIPNYRYRMILEPLAAAAVGGALARIAFHWRPNQAQQDSIPPTNANG